MSIPKAAYLPGLNTLRFLAAFFVIISHAQQSLFKLGVTNFTTPVLQKGGEGVEFFFVLSGFLITYLLCKEISKTNQISIKDFYLRRIFRIWPLYFIIIIIGLVLLGIVYPILFNKPYFEFSIYKWLLLFIFFLPNLATIMYPMGLLHPLWSIGVEEQFYLFWAPLVKAFKKNLLSLILIFISISSLWQIVILNNIIKISEPWYGFFKFQKFYAMSIGSFFGYALYNYKYKFQSSIFSNKILQIIVLVFCLIHLFTTLPIAGNFLYRFLLACCFGLIIINTACVETTIFKIEKKPFIYLGTISYGLYMYHMVVDYFLRIVFGKLYFTTNSTFICILYHVLLLILTIIVASFSFKYIESYFLKFKEKYVP